MRYATYRAVGLLLAFLFLLTRPGFAAGPDPVPVSVKFAGGDSRIIVIESATKLFGNRKNVLASIPPELVGMQITHRAYGASQDATITAPAGTTVYLMVSTDKTMDKTIVGYGWTKIADANYGDKFPLSVFKRDITSPQQITLSGKTTSGFIIAAKNLVLDTAAAAGGNAGAPAAPVAPADSGPATTVHTDVAVDTTPIPGPSTEPANQQATIQSLEVQIADTGAMAGQTSEVTLTITPGDSPTLTTVRFVTPVGDEMCLARDEALRFIHLTYPNWNVDKAEITFEDKYDAHDGGSIGAALGTMILSVIQGFDIDPDAAITGDISANGKVRAIGGLSAKLKGAIASKCTVVAVPSDNYDQLVDGVVYNGLDIVTDVQVIGIANLKDAVATVRLDRDAKLSQAIALFATFQDAAKDKPAYLTTAEARDILTRVLKLAPQHLSAKILLAASQGTLPKTLSPTASYYYISLSVGPMLAVLNERVVVDGANKVPSTVVRSGLENLTKLRPLVDAKVQPLVDAWSRFIQAWNALQAGTGSLDTAEATRQRLIEESVKEGTDADMMQKMLKEGI